MRKISNCKECGVELLVAGIHYLHPTGTECNEDDGTRVIDNEVFKHFQKKYGNPPELQIELDMLEEQNSLLKAKISELESETWIKKLFKRRKK